MRPGPRRSTARRLFLARRFMVRRGGRIAGRRPSPWRPRLDGRCLVARIVRLAGEDALHQRREELQTFARIIRIERALVPGGAEVHARLVPAVIAQPLTRIAIASEVM